MKTTSTESSTLLAAGFHALSDSLRMQIIDELREAELCVCDLCKELDIAQSKLSFHLKILKKAGLVQSRAEGRWIYYRLNLAQFIALEEYLSEFRRFSPIWPARKCE